jgi:hypothetical protein
MMLLKLEVLLVLPLDSVVAVLLLAQVCKRGILLLLLLLLVLKRKMDLYRTVNVSWRLLKIVSWRLLMLMLVQLTALYDTIAGVLDREQ